MRFFFWVMYMIKSSEDGPSEIAGLPVMPITNGEHLRVLRCGLRNDLCESGHVGVFLTRL